MVSASLASASCARTNVSIRVGGGAHLIGLVNIDNQGIAGMEKWLDSNGLADLHRAGFATDRLQQPIELSIDLRVEHALRDELMNAKEHYHAKAASGHRLQREDRRDRRDGLSCRTSIRTIRKRRMIPIVSTV